MVLIERDEDTKHTNVEQLSDIQKYFKDSTVLLTGGTGFLGKIILEKLLRSCSDIKKVYLIIRTKKGKQIEQRFAELLESVLFDRLKQEQPKFAEKIVLISGDCVLPNLGLNDADKNSLINDVNCIFHCAATVRFNEKIRTATHINVRATRDIMALAREAKQLKSIVYISTAYSNCTSQEIREEFYPPNIKGEHLINIVDALNEDMLEQMTPIMVGKWPNTYAFTKAIAEEIIQTEGKGLPIAVVRPSFVLATSKEPVAGWIDSIYGAAGIMVGISLGLIRSCHCKADCLVDIVPADHAINCSIAAAWQIGIAKHSNVNYQMPHEETLKQADSKPENDILIYNYVSSPQKPISWQEFMRIAKIYIKQVPSPLMVWHFCFRFTSSSLLHKILVLFLHKVPAYIVDLFLYCTGKEPMLIKGYKKIDTFLQVLTFFTTQEWEFKNDNTQELWKKLSKEDQKYFNFAMDTFDWDTYISTFIVGARIYLLKDPMETLPQGWVKYWKLKIAHYSIVALLLLGLFKMLMILWNTVF